MQEEHVRKVDILKSQVKEHHKAKIPFKIFHGSTNSTRILTFKKSQMIDTSNFDKVLDVNAKRKIVILEPNVPMDALVDATMAKGFLPPVVTEFPGITVGGAIQGGAGESSSFKHGFFSQTVNWVDYVLANGDLMRASPKENADLFYGAAGSSGTLGVIVAMEVRLVDAKKYVQIEYERVDGFESVVNGVASTSNQDYDFIDAIMFSPKNGMIARGKLTNERLGNFQRFNRASDPWYYLFVSKMSSTSNRKVAIPLKDYLFRYDRGAFWVGKYAFARFGVPFNALTRFILDPLLHTRKLYQALQDSGASQEHIVQDLCLPLDKAEEFLNFIDKETATYPLWICPIKPEVKSPLLCNGIDTPMVINVGVWGSRIENHDEFVALNKKIESKLMALNGKKWMYAHTYYTAKDFWKIYDKEWYDKLRHKYHADTLPNMYEKVVVTKKYEVNAKRGLLKTLVARAKLRFED